MNETPSELIQDLEHAGVHVEGIWDLVNGRSQYRTAIPVLIEWLEQLDDRVASADKTNLREALVRALSVPAARPTAGPALIAEFGRVTDPTGLGLRWTIGNALSVVADDSILDDMLSIAENRSYGKARQMVVLGLGRFQYPRVVDLLIDLVTDDDVVLHALKALAKISDPRTRAAVESMLDHRQAPVRREAQKALARLATGK